MAYLLSSYSSPCQWFKASLLLQKENSCTRDAVTVIWNTFNKNHKILKCLAPLQYVFLLFLLSSFWQNIDNTLTHMSWWTSHLAVGSPHLKRNYSKRQTNKSSDWERLESQMHTVITKKKNNGNNLLHPIVWQFLISPPQHWKHCSSLPHAGWGVGYHSLLYQVWKKGEKCIQNI